MNDFDWLPSLNDYKNNDKNVEIVTTRQGDVSLPELVPKSKSKLNSISPFKSGGSSAISKSARKRALDFAHPVDSQIIKTLDNPAINSVFNKVVQASIDAGHGLTLASGIHVSRETYNDLYDIILECADSLDIPVPYVVISNAQSGINAYTAGTDQFAFIVIGGLMPFVMKPEELKFVIGHECGHLALGHVVYHTAGTILGSAGGLVPLVGKAIAKAVQYPMNAWSRRSEISADRAGLICCKDIEVAKRALFRLEAGFMNIDNIDIDAYVAESERVLENMDLGMIGEFTHSHPLIPKRIKALDNFARSEAYARAVGNAYSEDLLTDKELYDETERIIAIM